MPPRMYLALVAVLTSTFAVVGVGWSVLTPAFHAPDEPQHLNSTLRIMTGHGWPAPGEAYLTEGTVVAMQEAGFGSGYAVFTTDAQVPRFGRSVVTELDGPYPDADSPSYDQMTQHPPAYYALWAALLTVLGADDWPWDDQLLALRLLGVGLVSGVVPLAAGSARLLTGSSEVGTVAAAVPLAVPQFTHIAATVSNDTLTTLAGAAVTYLVVRAMVLGTDGRTTVWTGIALGVGLLTKGFLLAAIPLVAIALLLAPRRGRATTARTRLGSALLALVIAFAIGGWWWLRNLVVHGTLQPSGAPEMLPDAESAVTTSTIEFLVAATVRLSQSFWGNFGWLDLALPFWIVVGAQLALLASAVGAAIWAIRNRRLRALTVCWLYPGAILAIVLVGAHANHQRTGLYPGLQGRYLFSAIVVIALTVALATALLPPRHRWVLPPVAATVAVAAACGALVFAFIGMWGSDGAAVSVAARRWSEWGFVPPAALALGSGLIVLLGLAAATTALLAARRARPAVTAEAREPELSTVDA
ncbi:DUF2142 domain-containing protein [Actinotalea sp.]|uniref:DUF2142 domain-containing protein n=1 Tax=Actinotalea sp. TaxID=1872145 RepID=UPI003566C658